MGGNREVYKVMTPNERIIEFLENLPNTIRDNIYMQIVLFFSKDKLLPPRTDFASVSNSIIIPDDTSLFANLYAAVTVSGILDFIFSRKTDKSALMIEKIAEEIGSIHLKKIALGIPFQERHFDQARSSWMRLRESHLSLEALHEFRATLLASLGHNN